MTAGMITATTRFAAPTGWVGSRMRAACTRCGRVRQVGDRTVDLCADCKTTDPNVWDRTSWVPWDGTEGDDDE